MTSKRVFGVPTEPSHESNPQTPPPELIECPICNESMISLSQLNQHIDDIHNDLNTITEIETSLESNDLTSWFKKKVNTKQVNELQKKLINLDLFDTNSNTSTPPSIIKTHWQKSKGYGNDYCFMENCHKPLSIKNGSINCRRCGKLYCNEHTYYKTKLSFDADYDINGNWFRCCETCFLDKPNRNDSNQMMDLTAQFREKRQPIIDDLSLNLNKLEKKFIRSVNMLFEKDLTQRLLNYNLMTSISQKVVTWEYSPNCYICFKKFNFLNKQHHCKLCGKSVCQDTNDVMNSCSIEIPIILLIDKLNNLNYSTMVTNSLDSFRNSPINDYYKLRLCTNCKDKLFYKKNFQLQNNQLIENFNSITNLIRIIEILKKSEHGLSNNVPKLINNFKLLQDSVKNLNGYNAETSNEIQLKNNIYNYTINYINSNNGYLKGLSKNASNTPSESETSSNITITNNMNNGVNDMNDKIEQPDSSKLLKRDIKMLREQLMVMNEQKFLVVAMIEEAKNQRKFDEIGSLNENLNEIEKQIGDLEAKLGEFGF